MIVDEKDEIAFQLRDFADQKRAQRNNDHIYGDFIVQCSDLMVNDGKTREFSFRYW